MRMRRSCLTRALAAGCVLVLTAPGWARAQEAAARADDRPPAECFRFAFGAWNPPLDWTASGHRDKPQAAAGAHGRENAAHVERDGGPLLLFPSFWPAGVLIRFDRTVAGDTLRGTATALVADAARTPSVAAITALRVPCSLTVAP